MIRYQITDDFTPDEISFLESQLVEACKLVRDAIKELKESSRKALEAMTDVFLCYDDNARNTILKKYAEIYEVLLGKMVFKRKEIYKEKGKSLDYVYLSTMPIPIQLQFTTNFLSVINTLKEFLLVQVGLFMKLLMSQDFEKK